MKNRILEMLSPPPVTHQAPRRARPPVDVKELRSQAERWIAENPGLALGAALTVGVLIGWLIKRK